MFLSENRYPPSPSQGHAFPEHALDLSKGDVTVRKLALGSIILLLLSAGAALALSDKPYLMESDADFANLLPPPPADGSSARMAFQKIPNKSRSSDK